MVGCSFDYINHVFAYIFQYTTSDVLLKIFKYLTRYFLYEVFKVQNYIGRFLPNGDKGIRTLDPLLARQVLSQLSYTPI